MKHNHLRDDLGERHNLAAQYSEKLRELAAEMRRLFAERGAQLPILKATGATVPLPGD